MFAEIYLFSLVEVSLSVIWTALAALAIVAVAVGVIWYNLKHGTDKGKDRAITNLKAAFDSEHILRVQAEEEAKRANGELEKEKETNARCEKALRDIGRFNLRLQAREEKYQESINRLERKLELPPTRFEDFNQHLSDA